MTNFEKIKAEMLMVKNDAVYAKYLSTNEHQTYDLIKYMSQYADLIKEAVEHDTRKEERRFILNVLDGIDIADGKSATKVIRKMLQVRSL